MGCTRVYLLDVFFQVHLFLSFIKCIIHLRKTTTTTLFSITHLRTMSGKVIRSGKTTTWLTVSDTMSKYICTIWFFTAGMNRWAPMWHKHSDSWACFPVVPHLYTAAISNLAQDSRPMGETMGSVCCGLLTLPWQPAWLSNMVEACEIEHRRRRKGCGWQKWERNPCFYCGNTFDILLV